jgi:glucan phosphoethanolaminetransferase (alkaline phosphatase superfamily)
MILLVAGILLSFLIVLTYPSVFLQITALAKARYIVLELSFFCAYFCSICLVGIQLWSRLKSPALKKTVVFFLLWLLMPLSIFLLTLTFAHRSMYISIIPLSGILTIMLIEGFPFFFQHVRNFFSRNKSRRLSAIKPAIGGWLIIAGTMTTLLAFSPIFKSYGEWKDSGEISRELLQRLSEITAQLPDGAVLHIFNLPSGISSYENKITALKEATYLADYSIESWLNLHRPKGHMEVIVQNTAKLAVWPSKLRLAVEKKEDNIFKINVEVDMSKSQGSEEISQRNYF